MDTIYSNLFIDKTTQPFADGLTAAGLMRIAGELLFRGGGGDIMLKDCGSYYELALSRPLTIELINQASPGFNPAPYILTVKNAAALPEGAVWADYEVLKAQVKDYYDSRAKGGDAAPPDPKWDTYRAINPAALPGYNATVTHWNRVRNQPEVLKLLFDLFSSVPNDIEGAMQAWKQLDKVYGWGIKAEATGQQLYNPEMGKGQNRAKSDGLSIGNLDGFWLVEWVKSIGFYEVAITRQVRGSKDRKTFVLAAREMNYSVHQQVMDQFTQSMQFSETPARMDILVAIRYTQALLNHTARDNSFQQRLLRSSSIRKRLVAGFFTAYYKDLGNAVATMNLSFIALPGWVQIDTPADVATHLTLLEEFETIVRQFDESHSDAFTLLQHLRDFVSGDNLDAFFRFTDAFPAYYMSMRERGRYAVQLSSQFIERLVMTAEVRLSEILMNQGFQNIAYAIRQSTVVAQYRKKQGERKYDVRYGLGQELARKARYPQEFAAALADFLHRYNAENAQVMETRPKPYRRSVRTSDIDDVIALIDRFGSETVANLLIAYGYARSGDEGSSADQDNAQPTDSFNSQENEA
jgi:hypothetical protein